MYNTSAELLQYINNDNWHSIIGQTQGKYVVDVYLNNDDRKYRNVFNQSYVIQIDGKMKKENSLVLLFPRHPDEHKRVLRTNDYRNYHSLGKEINIRLKDSVCVDSDSAVKLAIVSQDRIYRFRSLLGTAYVIWATRVNQASINDQENTIATDVPVFYEFDGQWNPRNVVIFPVVDEFIEEKSGHYSMYPIQLGCITNLLQTNTVLFSYEADNRKTEHKTIKTVSADRAEQITRDLVARRYIDNISSSELPFDGASDSEDSIVVMADDSTGPTYNIEYIPETPRVHK